MVTDAEARAFTERSAAAAAATVRAQATARSSGQRIDNPMAAPVDPNAPPPVTTTIVAPPGPNRTPPTAPQVLSRTAAPGVKTPAGALQTAAPLNSTLPDAYQYIATVLMDGVDIGPPIAFEVSSNNYYQADRYFAELATGALPKGYQLDYWASGAQKKVEIQCAIYGIKHKSLIIGLIDDCEIDWLQRVIRIRGRDLTSLLIDNKTAEKFPNKTSSQVAEILATRRGLSSKITPTTTLVGSYFQREHARLTADVTEHDLLTFLAEQEGFSYWVEGSILHFEQPPAENTSPFVVTYTPPTPAAIASGNFVQLTTKRNETLAKDIIVKVVSWSPKTKHRVEAKATRTRVKNTSGVTRHTTGGSDGVAQAYVFRIPGLTQEQAQAKANSLAADISKHERNIRIEMPFDPVLDCRARLSLRGTKTEFDQAYYIDSIEYSGSYEQGSRMEIHGKNNSPLSQVTI